MSNHQEKRKKLAVVLFNLGGPTGRKTIYPFLVNFFMDRNIIPLPAFFRFFLSRYIASTRSRRNGPAGEAYGAMGGKSPLLENTLAQQFALQAVLEQRLQDYEIRVYSCMRYWHPMADTVVAQVQSFAPDQLVLLSLYPQMSSTTFWSSLQDWLRVAKNYGYRKMPSVICCYPQDKGYISASAALLHEHIEKCRANTGKMPRILFSAHSLPEKLVRKGDPYEYHCRKSVTALLAALNEQYGMADIDYRMSYQSKIGPQKWLGPQTIDEIRQAAKDAVPLLVYPYAFVSEHVETIVELGIEYRHEADKNGLGYYDVVPTVGTHPDYINGLANMVVSRKDTNGVFAGADHGGEICPPEFGWCCKRRAEKERIFADCNE